MGESSDSYKDGDTPLFSKRCGQLSGVFGKKILLYRNQTFHILDLGEAIIPSQANARANYWR